MRALVAVLVLLAPLTLSVEPVAAVPGLEHTLLNGATLKGVRACCGDDQVPGLTNDGMQAAAEARLEAAGIPISADGQAVLFVPAHVAARTACFATVEWALYEDARLERNHQLVPVQSRNGGATFIAGTDLDDCGDQVLTAVERAVDDFARLHAAMNGRPRTP